MSEFVWFATWYLSLPVIITAILLPTINWMLGRWPWLFGEKEDSADSTPGQGGGE